MHKTRILAGLAIITLIAGCATPIQQGTKPDEPSPPTTLGATIGAVFGAITSGSQGAAAGAVIGGGIGHALSGNDQQKELADAKLAGENIQQYTHFKLEITSQAVKDEKSGVTVEELKQLAFTLKADEVVVNHHLSDNAALTLGKLSALAERNGRRLVVLMPKATSKNVVKEIAQAAPKAKVQRMAKQGRAVFELLPAKEGG